tara:strand:- start:153 stop:350 length:198 start_codon:yes stop_codon:yes gene_type:complete
MTYEELLELLKALESKADNRLQDTVMVWDMEQGEYHPTELLTIEESDGIMQAGQILLGFGISMEA